MFNNIKNKNMCKVCNGWWVVGQSLKLFSPKLGNTHCTVLLCHFIVNFKN